MNIRSQKGFTGADVTVAVLILTVFSAIIVTLYQNYISTTKQIERKAEAIQYAVEEMEKIKQNSSEFFTEENAPLQRQTIADNEPIDNTGYSKTVFLEDYSTLGLREGAIPGYVKKVNVKIEYKIGKNTETVELNTIISRQEIIERNTLGPGSVSTKTEKDNYQDLNNDKATIPEEFKISENDNEIDTGLVVEAPDGSEFVWVPVEKAIAENEEAGESTKSMAVKDSDGTNYRGILYKYSETNSSVISGCTTSNFVDTSSETSYREPDFLKNSAYGDENPINNGRVTESKLKNEFKKMIESVAKYGGFYVARYETSLNGSKAQSKIGQTPMDATESSGNTWYGIYEKERNYASSNGISSVVGSSMMWGSQYDAMLNWILKGNDASKVTESSIQHERTKTGSTPEDVMNKIYDLRTNLREWTLQAKGTYYRVTRGGYYDNHYSAAHDGYSAPIHTNADSGSRIALYIL